MTVVVRNTRETQIRVEVAPGTGTSNVDTTIQFLDHMLVTLARYASLDLEVTARGDLRHQRTDQRVLLRMRQARKVSSSGHNPNDSDSSTLRQTIHAP